MDREDFIGTTRVLPNGSTLTVTGNTEKFNDKGWWVGKFICHCTVCSLDQEVWPERSITVTKGHFKDTIPCGCSPSPKLTSRQVILLLKRHCSRYNIEIESVPTKTLRATKVKLKRIYDGKRFTASLLELEKSVSGDLSGKSDKRGKSIEEHLSEFVATGKFTEGTIFNPTSDYKYWEVVCPKCLQDEYTSNNLCSGKFIAKIDNLKNGKVPCRCTPYIFTEDQWKYRIEKLLKDEGHFTSIEYQTFNKGDTSFTWKCKEGHYQRTRFSNFIHSNNRCATCVGITQKLEGYGRGYYPHRLEELDNLYITKVLGSNPLTFKIGRSFNYKYREKDLKKVSKDRFELVRLFEGTHEDVFKEEQRLHAVLDAKGKNAYVGWTEECFFLTSKQVKELIVNLEEI